MEEDIVFNPKIGNKEGWIDVEGESVTGDSDLANLAKLAKSQQRSGIFQNAFLMQSTESGDICAEIRNSRWRKFNYLDPNARPIQQLVESANCETLSLSPIVSTGFGKKIEDAGKNLKDRPPGIEELPEKAKQGAKPGVSVKRWTEVGSAAN